MPPFQRTAIKDHMLESSMYVSRTVVAFVLILCMIGILIGRMLYLQVVQHENYTSLSDRNRVSITALSPNRGNIYDRRGILLAKNQAHFSLELIPEKIKDLDKTIKALQQILPISESEVERFHKRRKQQRRFKKVALKNQMTQEEVSLFSVNSHLFDGISIEARLERHYPFGESLAHLLGYVGHINADELKRLDPVNYRATRHIGKIGVEKHYEDILHGSVGYREVETDARSRVVKILKTTPPVSGQDIYLNIDYRLQILAHQLIKEERGSAIALNPKTGQVLAIASAPAYNPNLFVNGIDFASYSELRDSPDRPLFNRSLRGRYSPGSTIKPHIALLGLESGTVSSRYSISDPGYYQLPNEERLYRDWKKWGHGRVNITDAIRESCDTYYYDLANRLGIDKMSDYMYQFGFGHKTNIDTGEEVTGIMPSRDWKRKNRGTVWYPGETLITGIGQGFWTSTPIQLAQATATLANRGKGYQPQLVKAINKNGNISIVPLKPNKPIDISRKSNWDVVFDAMREVNENSRGTAFNAFKKATYSSAGKTGTAQVIGIAQDEEYDEEKISKRHRDNALYMGYAPFEDPEIAVIVVLENAGHGGSESAPVARKIMDKYFELKASEQW